MEEQQGSLRPPLLTHPITMAVLGAVLALSGSLATSLVAIRHEERIAVRAEEKNREDAAKLALLQMQTLAKQLSSALVEFREAGRESEDLSGAQRKVAELRSRWDDSLAHYLFRVGEVTDTVLSVPLARVARQFEDGIWGVTTHTREAVEARRKHADNQVLLERSASSWLDNALTCADALEVGSTAILETMRGRQTDSSALSKFRPHELRCFHPDSASL